MSRFFSAALAAFVLLAAPAAASAHEYKIADLTVTQAWARVIITSRPGAAYLRIDNAGMHGDRLIGVSSSKADRVELHTHIMENDIAAMRQVDAIDIPAHGMATLVPGGDHIMLFDLDEGLETGMTIPLTLEFERSGSIEIEIEIMRNPPEGAATEGGMSHDGHTGEDDGTSHEGHSDSGMADDSMSHDDDSEHSGHGSD